MRYLIGAVLGLSLAAQQPDLVRLLPPEHMGTMTCTQWLYVRQERTSTVDALMGLYTEGFRDALITAQVPIVMEEPRATVIDRVMKTCTAEPDKTMRAAMLAYLTAQR